MLFHVQKATLAMASDVFRDTFLVGFSATLFQAPEISTEPNDESGDVIDVAEHSEVIDPLLRFINPVREPIIKTIETNVAIMEASKKYGMPLVQERIREQLEAKAKSEPLRVYAIGLAKARVCLEDEVRMAAKLSLVHPLCPWSDTLPIEFENISGGDYKRLLYYRNACSNAVTALFTEMKTGSEVTYVCPFLSGSVASFPTWLFDTSIYGGGSRIRVSLHASMPLVDGNNPLSPSHGVYAASWWATWMVKAIGELKERPHPAIMTDEFFRELLVKAISAQPHQVDVPGVVSDFRKVFVKAVTEAMDRVSFRSLVR